MSVEERVKEIVSKKLNVAEDIITPGSSFVEDLGAISLDSVELIMAYEDDFGIQIPEEDAAKLVTVQDAVDYIKGKISLDLNKGASPRPPGSTPR